MPAISVCLTSYNGADYIEERLTGLGLISLLKDLAYICGLI